MAITDLAAPARSKDQQPAQELIAEMAMVLRTQDIRLDDERAVLLTLNRNRFQAGDIVAFVDDAILAARAAMSGGQS
jgi:hypothetical protein